MLHFSLLVLAALALLSGLIPLMSSFLWVADLFSHFRVQYLVGTSILFVLCSLLRARAAAWMTVPALLLHLVPVALTELPTKTQTAFSGSEPYSLLVMNVLARNHATQALAERINSLDADTVILIELTPAMQQHLQTSIDYPNYFGLALPGANGVGVFSRHKFTTSSLPRFGVTHAPAVHVTQSIAGLNLTLVGVHPLAPITSAMYADRNQQFTQLATFAQQHEGPLIIAGDFNSTPWSGHFATLLENSGLSDGTHGWGLNGTWPGCIPLLSIPIDHALVSKEVLVSNQSTVEVPGSDHCGLMLELQIDSAGAEHQSAVH